MEHDNRATRREPPTLGSLPVRHFPFPRKPGASSDCQWVRRWNAARALARYLERTPTLYSGKDVLELGAGAGLPSLVVAKSGARTVRTNPSNSLPLCMRLTIWFAQVVMTDYPDQALVDNMKYNAAQNGVEVQVAVRGYVWGRPVEPLLEPTGAKKFDLILLSDLIFHHAEVRWGAPTLLT